MQLSALKLTAVLGVAALARIDIDVCSRDVCSR